MRPVDLQRVWLVLLDVLEREVGSLEEVRARIDLRAPLEARLEMHFEDLVGRLFSGGELDDGLKFFGLGVELDAVLLGERSCEVGTGEQPAPDENLAQPRVSLPLLCQRLLELRFGQEALIDEQLAERTPERLLVRFLRTELWRIRK